MKDEEISKTPDEPKNIFEPIDFTIFRDEVQDDFHAICSKTAPGEKSKKALILSKYLLFRKLSSNYSRISISVFNTIKNRVYSIYYGAI